MSEESYGMKVPS